MDPLTGGPRPPSNNTSDETSTHQPPVESHGRVMRAWDWFVNTRAVSWVTSTTANAVWSLATHLRGRVSKDSPVVSERPVSPDEEITIPRIPSTIPTSMTKSERILLIKKIRPFISELRKSAEIQPGDDKHLIGLLRNVDIYQNEPISGNLMVPFANLKGTKELSITHSFKTDITRMNILLNGKKVVDVEIPEGAEDREIATREVLNLEKAFELCETLLEQYGACGLKNLCILMSQGATFGLTQILKEQTKDIAQLGGGITTRNIERREDGILITTSIVYEVRDPNDASLVIEFIDAEQHVFISSADLAKDWVNIRAEENPSITVTYKAVTHLLEDLLAFEEVPTDFSRPIEDEFSPQEVRDNSQDLKDFLKGKGIDLKLIDIVNSNGEIIRVPLAFAVDVERLSRLSFNGEEIGGRAAIGERFSDGTRSDATFNICKQLINRYGEVGLRNLGALINQSLIAETFEQELLRNREMGLLLTELKEDLNFHIREDAEENIHIKVSKGCILRDVNNPSFEGAKFDLSREVIIPISQLTIKWWETGDAPEEPTLRTISTVTKRRSDISSSSSQSSVRPAPATPPSDFLESKREKEE